MLRADGRSGTIRDARGLTVIGAGEGRRRVGLVLMRIKSGGTIYIVVAHARQKTIACDRWAVICENQ